MIGIDITSSIHAVIADLQAADAKAPQAMVAPQTQADKAATRYTQEIAPYRTGALSESLHAVGPTVSGEAVESEIVPGDDITYARYLVAKGGRLDWTERTADERPDIAETAAQQSAEAVAKLLRGEG